MKLSLPSETLFHSIESTIKVYRRFAQQNISKEISGITLDQSLTLIYLEKNPDMTQHELADFLFKDNASLTRMINTMVNNKILKRSMNEEDRRRYKLQITKFGKEILDKLPTIISSNRKKAQSGLSKEEITQLNTLLEKIKTNCQI